MPVDYEKGDGPAHLKDNENVDPNLLGVPLGAPLASTVFNPSDMTVTAPHLNPILVCLLVTGS
jgi:hypothetical protein